MAPAVEVHGSAMPQGLPSASSCSKAKSPNPKVDPDPWALAKTADPGPVGVGRNLSFCSSDLLAGVCAAGRELSEDAPRALQSPGKPNKQPEARAQPGDAGPMGAGWNLGITTLNARWVALGCN